MLNLADMGIGIAITSYLYKPLAIGDQGRVAALMHMYKRVYEILGLIVLFVGIIISFFLEILIPDAHCSYGYLRLLFYINLAGTVSTYYLAYNRTFLIADQKTYITSVIDTVFYFAFSFLQIIILIIAPHYLAYLIINIVKNIVSNIFITISVKKHYNFSSVSIEKKIY